MAKDEVVLKLKDVNTYYGNIHALTDVSFEVKKGEIVTLIGSNGAGKSTTLRTISSIVKLRSGEIYFGDKLINTLPAHEVADLGIAHVPEGRQIFPKMTVEENLQMGAFRFKDNNKIRKSIEKVYEVFPRLKEREKQKGGTLSGGEQQMLAIGRSIMSEPSILMMDEPSMGLAPIMVELIFDIIKKLNSNGMTILLVEQNANKALKVADRGYVLQTGSIILEGTGEALLRNDTVREAYLG